MVRGVNMAEGILRHARGIRFLWLEGDSETRIRQHARLLRDEIRAGVLPVAGTKNHVIIRRGLRETLGPFLLRLPLWIYRDLLIGLLLKGREGPEFRKLNRAMAEETGLPEAVCRESVFHADALMFMISSSMVKHTLRELSTDGIPGCTSGIALGPHTKAGRMLACRNLDYPLVGPWEKHVSVQFHLPSGAGEIPYVAIGTSGVHTAGLTGFNRAGISIFTHAHYGRASLRGTPAVVIGDAIGRFARTVGEAVDIARKHKRIGNWAFMVADWGRGEAAAIEMTPDQLRVVDPVDGILTHSNYFRSKELRATESLLAGGIWDDLEARASRMRSLLMSASGSLDPVAMAMALGDHMDPKTGVSRVFGNTISVVTTVKSAVFDLQAGKFWLSNRERSPAGLGEFVEIDVNRLWDREFWNQWPADADWSALPLASDRHPTGLLRAVEHYREAYVAWQAGETSDADQTLASLSKAIAEFPADGNLWVQRGIVAFSVGRFEESRRSLEGALARSLSLHIGEVARLYLARCLDLAGERVRALALYSAWQGIREPRLRKAYRRGARRPFRAREARATMPDLQFADSLNY